MTSKTAANHVWYVAHTRPRREKKLVIYCQREGIAATLPCLKSVKRYGRKRREFEKPLFPGYVFFQGEREHRQKVYQNEHTANVLDVYDQTTFVRQLEDIVIALDNGRIIGGVINPCVGKEVRLLKGPLSGMLAVIVRVSDITKVILKLDFIGQGAAIVVDGTDFEIVG